MHRPPTTREIEKKISLKTPVPLFSYCTKMQLFRKQRDFCFDTSFSSPKSLISPTLFFSKHFFLLRFAMKSFLYNSGVELCLTLESNIVMCKVT